MAALDPAKSPLAPAQPPTNVNSILAQQPQRVAELQGDVAEADKKVADINTKEGAMKMPELQSVPQPTPQPTDPSKIWGSAAMLLAGLGGMMTRRPIVTAMNAASKVFEAYRSNDQEAARTAYDSWKIANENAMKVADFQQKQYKEALDGYEKDKAGALASLKAKMAAFQDTTGIQQLELHGIQGAQQHIIELERLQNDIAKAQPGLEKGNDQHMAAMTIKDAQKGYAQAQASKDPVKVQAAKEKLQAAIKDAQDLNAAYGSKGGDTTGSLDASDPSDKSYIQAIANYHVAPPSSGRNPAQRKALLEEVLKANPEYSEAKYGQAQKAMRDFGTGKQGDTARSLNVSVSHLETLRELGRALDNGNISLINAAKQRFAEELGVPAPTNFDTAKSIVADEVAKGVIGGSTAQNDRETLAAALRRERSFPAIEGSINTFQSLLGGQLGGLRSQYERTTGAKDFDQAFLSEGTRKALEGKEGAGGGGNSIPKVSTQAEYDALPSGATYTEEDGKKYKKP